MQYKTLKQMRRSINFPEPGILSGGGENMEITAQAIEKQFAGAADFCIRKLTCGDHTLYAYAIDGLVSGGDTSLYIMKPLMEGLKPDTMVGLYHQAFYKVIYNSVALPCRDLQDVFEKLVNGFCVVLFPEAGALAFEVKTGDKRGPKPPEVENTVKGPKDAFVETGRSNTSLVRRHLRTPDLRVYETLVGERSLTTVSLISIEGITDPSLVETMKQRLSEIHIDGFLSTAAVEEYITGSRMTAFPLLQYTERPDTFCRGLLDGRVGILVDGLPLGYLAPVDLGYLMESPEDRSRDAMTASALRILRYGALVMSLLLPGLYIAASGFHQEMIPLPLLKSIIETRKMAPFPVSAEILGLLLAFELLQESGIHLPQAIGQSVSTIGGIVVGTAAVEAGLISPFSLIVVSVAGVCGFALPSRDLASAIRLWRFGIGVLASLMGLFGVTVGLILLIIHLAGLKSLGIPWLAPFQSDPSGAILRKRLQRDCWRNERLNPRDRRNQA